MGRGQRKLLLVVLFASAWPVSGQTHRQTLPEQAEKQGSVRVERYFSSEGRDEGIDGLIIESSAIVRGMVVAERGYLTKDQTSVNTDYTIEISDAYMGQIVGHQVSVTKLGGTTFVNGHRIEVDTPQFPALPHEKPLILFLRNCAEARCEFEIVADAWGVAPLRAGRIDCSSMRDGRENPWWKPYCDLTESEFRTQLQEHIARVKPGSSPK
ncbi:MAG TPA: hypothetical protein VFO34_06580 [Candidatus Acidoferrales bacterium]|nr:hypothetical protein [Candidatus Acidoferrales bacterium]